MLPRPPRSTLFPYTTLFHLTKNSYLSQVSSELIEDGAGRPHLLEWRGGFGDLTVLNRQSVEQSVVRSEEHTSELQSRFDLVCRLLLEKKNTKNTFHFLDI